MLCRSPHLFSVVTLPQENKVPFNNACTYESVPLTAGSRNVNDKNVQAEQNHSNSQCPRKCHNLCSSVCLQQIHNSEGFHASRRWPRQNTCCGIADYASTNCCFSSLMSITGDLYTCSCSNPQTL